MLMLTSVSCWVATLFVVCCFCFVAVAFTSQSLTLGCGQILENEIFFRFPPFFTFNVKKGHSRRDMVYSIFKKNKSRGNVDILRQMLTSISYGLPCVYDGR